MALERALIDSSIASQSAPPKDVRVAMGGLWIVTGLALVRLLLGLGVSFDYVAIVVTATVQWLYRHRSRQAVVLLFCLVASFFPAYLALGWYKQTNLRVIAFGFVLYVGALRFVNGLMHQYSDYLDGQQEMGPQRPSA